MIKPPYTKWINDIKTKLGFNRTMTASGADVVDAVNKQAEKIANLGPYNGLDSTSTTAALSAAQGKALDSRLSNIEGTSWEYLTVLYATGSITNRVSKHAGIGQLQIGSMVNIASSSFVATNIPVGYRPALTVNTMGIDQEGTQFDITIGTGGDVVITLFSNATRLVGGKFVTYIIGG